MTSDIMTENNQKDILSRSNEPENLHAKRTSYDSFVVKFSALKDVCKWNFWNSRVNSLKRLYEFKC